ncbi:unnamed protein product [Brassica napus]|uniref:(rape) hypothetical protein n=1 Tax=Brassica napus TaxID=3708 RepID=A0A816VXP4_BRANA|nr:unnamed protein product [Brassica napus]
MLDIAYELVGQATSNSLLMFCFCNIIIVIIITGSSKPGSMDSQDYNTFTTPVSFNNLDHDCCGDNDDHEDMIVIDTMMDPDMFAEDPSFNEKFDIDFEFDAPRFYDFSKPELDSETEETELWFESAGNYPPSPFSLNLSCIFDDKHLKIHKPVTDKYNGFIYYNQTANNLPKSTQKSKNKPFLRKNSTLTRPTASLLARQNKPLDIYSVQLLTRCQRSLGRLESKISPSILLSVPQTQDTKRQKLESGFLRKISRLEQTPFVHKVPKKLSKVTVPKEPNLKTAQRATRQRFKANSAPEQVARFSSTMTKTVQESSSHKKSTPGSQDFQRFQLRTSLRAKERSSSAKNAPMDDPTHSLMLVHGFFSIRIYSNWNQDFSECFFHILCRSKSVVSRNSRRVKESHSSKTNSQVYESKISHLESKVVPRKFGEAMKIKHENNFSRAVMSRSSRMASLQLLTLLFFFFFTVSKSIDVSKPHAAESFDINLIQNFGSCRYTVIIRTSCSSPRYTRDQISLSFGDGYRNQVYAPRLDDPGSRAFERCSSDTYEINGPCVRQICYVYVHRSGPDGWVPESVQIFSHSSKAVTFTFNTHVPESIWFGHNYCNTI